MIIRLLSVLLLAGFVMLATLPNAVALDVSLVGRDDTSGNAIGVTLSGAYAYIADYSGGLVVVDVSDPTNPFRAGGYDTFGSARGVAVSGDYAYVADGTKGLMVVDVSDPANPFRAGGYNAYGNARDVAVSGGYAYVAYDTNGLAVLGLDSDHDGILDSLDAFPNDPDEQFDTDGDGVGDNVDPMPTIGIITAWWQVGLILSVVIASGITGTYKYNQFTLSKRVSSKADEVRAKIAEFKEKGVNTDELERVLAEYEAE